MKYLSLFSGIGGFELGIQQAYENKSNREYIQESGSGRADTRPSGDKPDLLSRETRRNSEYATCIGFSEIDKYATQIYQKHFPNHKNYGDITKINPEELPDFDLLVGGFPCQAFSIAGKRKGFEDTRGTLFFDIARILRAKQPRLLLLENVKGLLSHDNGKTFSTIISTLDELGYDLQWQVLNSKNFGVPQNRERVFIIGHLRGTSRPQVFPIGESGGLSNTSDGQRTTKSGISPAITSNYKRGVHSGGEAYVQSNKSGLQQVRDFTNDTDSRGGQTHPSNIRRLTPKECERLQGFPDGWTEGVSDTQRYKCLGNAVTVNVIKAIIEKLL